MSNKTNAKTAERIKTLRMIRTSAIIRNPLLLEAIGLCPVVAIATTLKSALFLALVTAIELIVCEVLASRFLKNVRRYWRVALYFFIGAAIVFPIMYLVTRFVPAISLEFGVFLPLMAVNSLLALHCERVAVKRTVKDSFLDSVSVSVSYGIVTVVTGFLREFLGSGTVSGKNLHFPFTFPVMLTPFGGLLILGFAAAFLKYYIYKKYPQSSPDRAFNTSEVRQSLNGTLRELMNDDFNPYDEGEDGGSATDVSGDADSLRNINKAPKPPKAKKENKHSEKVKKADQPKKRKTEKSEKQTERPVKTVSQERTYLDDFSDMLTDLQNYKSQENANTAEENGKKDKDESEVNK